VSTQTNDLVYEQTPTLYRRKTLCRGSTFL